MKVYRGLLFLNEVSDNSVRCQSNQREVTILLQSRGKRMRVHKDHWALTRLSLMALCGLPEDYLSFVYVASMYIVSISLIFCTLFAKDASIQMGISLLPVLQLTKFVADLDYTVCQTSIKMITEKYNTAMYMMTWR